MLSIGWKMFFRFKNTHTYTQFSLKPYHNNKIIKWISGWNWSVMFKYRRILWIFTIFSFLNSWKTWNWFRLFGVSHLFGSWSFGIFGRSQKHTHNANRIEKFTSTNLHDDIKFVKHKINRKSNKEKEFVADQLRKYLQFWCPFFVFSVFAYIVFGESAIPFVTFIDVHTPTATKKIASVVRLCLR